MHKLNKTNKIAVVMAVVIMTSANPVKANVVQETDFVTWASEVCDETKSALDNGVGEIAAYVNNVNAEDFIDIAEDDGVVNAESVDRANEILNELPESMLVKFQENGWHFYVTDKNIDQQFFEGKYGSVMGITRMDHESIYIEDRPEAIETATLHEFGHYIDNINGMLSNTAEFHDVYNAESPTFVDIFNVDFHYDILEFFAEGFYKFYTEREKLQENCPHLFEYIKDVIDSETAVA